MYEARQNKGKVSRIVSQSSMQLKNKNTIKYNNLFNFYTKQFLREKVKNYDEIIRYQTVLYATLDGKPVGTDGGIFKSEGPDKHAEDNLILYLRHTHFPGKGDLIIYLSTSPCSSTFGTRKGEGEGCLEKLEELSTMVSSIHIYADHLYQPQALRQIESQEGLHSGFCSACSVLSSSLPFDIHRCPKSFKDSFEPSDVDVAQLTVLTDSQCPSQRICHPPVTKIKMYNL